MGSLLKIECINDAWGMPPEILALAKLMSPLLGPLPPRRYWVAEITGLSPKYRYERRFLPCKKDYSEANSMGSRGVYAYYILEEGRLYEVSAPRSWKRTERYFCTVRGGEIVKLTEEEVRACLSAR